MTNKSISQLTAGAAVSSTDVFPDVQTVGVGPVRVTAAQIGDYVLSGSGLTGVLPVSRGGTGLTSLGTGVATALGNAVNGASGLCVQDASGNLGVGSTTPAGTRLYINGGSLFTGSPGSSGVGISGSLTSGRIGTYDTNKATVINSYFDDSAIEISAGITSGYACGISITARNATNYANTVRFVTTGTEAARFDGSGNLLVGKMTSGDANAGISLFPSGRGGFTRSGGDSLYVNRLVSDGTLVTFDQDSTTEGTISVSGSTVSYNGGHLARWSQLSTDQRDASLLKGTVMSNLDEMCIWEKNGVPEANEQLNRMKISDVEGDINVAGVFVNWDNDDPNNLYDMNIAMTGDMIIRIATNVVVQKGDLLMSAGDGTAKPQGDDIIRAKTIAKVTSNHVTFTYDDGSYCVPCVLMAC
jgi:hypothetical protein